MPEPTLLPVPKASDDRAQVERNIRILLDAHGPDICGYAIVVWDSDGASVADMSVRKSSGVKMIPVSLVPDFVRNRLLAEKIEEWTINRIYDRKPVDPPEGA